MMTRKMPIGWSGGEPDAFLGRDEQGRDYWKMGLSVLRTTDTGTEDQATTWIGYMASWDLGRRVLNVKEEDL